MASSDNEVPIRIEKIADSFHYGLKDMSDAESLETWKFAEEWLYDLKKAYEKGHRKDVNGGGIKLQGEDD